MKKIYITDKCSSATPSSYHNESSISVVGIRYVFIFLLLFFSTPFFSQEAQISGSENIFISDGAIITSTSADSKDSSVNVINYVNNIKNKAIAKFAKKKKGIKSSEKYTSKKNSKKLIDDKVIKKVNEKNILTLICNGCEKSNENISHTNDIVKSCISNPDQIKAKYFSQENKFITCLFIYQKTHRISYQYHDTTFVRNNLFTRPPPVL